jgi:hypothetical protein
LRNSLESIATMAFYKLRTTSFEKALAKLLEKILETQEKAVVRVEPARDMEKLSHSLWTYTPGGFLPHGFQRDGQGDPYVLWQPIWLVQDVVRPRGSLEKFPDMGSVHTVIQNDTKNIGYKENKETEDSYGKLEKTDFLSVSQLNPNHSSVLVSTSSVHVQDFDFFKKVLFFFDGNDPLQCQNALEMVFPYQEYISNLDYSNNAVVEVKNKITAFKDEKNPLDHWRTAQEKEGALIPKGWEQNLSHQWVAQGHWETLFKPFECLV